MKLKKKLDELRVHESTLYPVSEMSALLREVCGNQQLTQLAPRVECKLHCVIHEIEMHIPVQLGHVLDILDGLEDNNIQNLYYRLYSLKGGSYLLYIR